MTNEEKAILSEYEMRYGREAKKIGSPLKIEMPLYSIGDCVMVISDYEYINNAEKPNGFRALSDARSLMIISEYPLSGRKILGKMCSLNM